MEKGAGRANEHQDALCLPEPRRSRWETPDLRPVRSPHERKGHSNP